MKLALEEQERWFYANGQVEEAKRKGRKREEEENFG